MQPTFLALSSTSLLLGTNFQLSPNQLADRAETRILYMPPKWGMYVLSAKEQY